MTCIVGLVNNGAVYMGADSAGVGGYDLTIRADKKIFKNNNFLIGYTTSFRMGQLLRYSFQPPLFDKNLDEYMVVDFVDAMRECFKKGGFSEKKNEVETGGSFLVGYKDRLFKIESDYQVGESANDYNACGSGQSVALGSLYATQGIAPELRVETALKAAQHFNAGVREPFHYIDNYKE